MPQTRMFRDRVVSMEQTFEGGEKHLDLLKTLCAEALPDFEYVGHFLEHERDLFVVELAARDGRKKRVGWTRMVLFDAERVPVLSGDPWDALRAKIVGYLRSRASHPEIVVTFRHLEEGWVDTPEPRRDRRRRRRGRGGERGREAGPARPKGPPGLARDRRERPGKAPAPAAAPEPKASRRGEPSAPPPSEPSGAREGRRRFRRRRRRGRAPGGGGVPPPTSE
jgi:hypothetical protein